MIKVSLLKSKAEVRLMIVPCSGCTVHSDAKPKRVTWIEIVISWVILAFIIILNRAMTQIGSAGGVVGVSCLHRCKTPQNLLDRFNFNCSSYNSGNLVWNSCFSADTFMYLQTVPAQNGMEFSYNKGRREEGRKKDRLRIVLCQGRTKKREKIWTASNIIIIIIIIAHSSCFWGQLLIL